MACDCGSFLHDSRLNVMFYHEEASGKRGQVTILVVFVSCSKLAEFLHATSISVEKHCPVIFLAALLFFFEK